MKKDWLAFGLGVAMVFGGVSNVSAERLSDIVFQQFEDAQITENETYPAGYRIFRDGHCVDMAMDGKCGADARPQRTFQRSAVGFRRRVVVPYWQKNFQKPNDNVSGWANSSYSQAPWVYNRRVSGYQFLTQTQKRNVVNTQAGGKRSKTVYDRYPDIFSRPESEGVDPQAAYIFSVPGMYLPHHAAIYGVDSPYLNNSGGNLSRILNTNLVDHFAGESSEAEITVEDHHTESQVGTVPVPRRISVGSAKTPRNSFYRRISIY